MKERITARFPRGPLLLMLVISLAGIYVCIDVRFLHLLPAAKGFHLNPYWYWPIFGLVLFLAVRCARQALLPTHVLVADVSGLEFNHRPLKSAVRVPWRNVRSIGAGSFSRPGQKESRSVPAIQFVVDGCDDLGGVTHDTVRVDGNAIAFAALLFEGTLEETLGDLESLRARARGGPPDAKVEA